jgi:hypothetical protein
MINRVAPKISRGIEQVADTGRNIGQIVKHGRNIGSIFITNYYFALFILLYPFLII